MAKVYHYEFTVVGRFNFPLDMLRYNRCWPKTESHDVVEMEHSFSPRFRNTHTDREITLIGLNYPTVARWDSFGWKVQLDSIKKLAQFK